MNMYKKKNKKDKLLEIVIHTLHLGIMDMILSELPKEKHESFLEQFSQSPDDPKLIDELKKNVGDIEDKIRKKAERIKKEILEELHKL